MKILENFKQHQTASNEIIAEYEVILPTDILKFWKCYGFGTFLNGYMKSVNPKDFEKILKESVSQDYHDAVVLFTTGMSDLIVWHKGYLILCCYRYGFMTTIMTRLDLFFRCLKEDQYLANELRIAPYFEAVSEYGELEYNEAFGYVPLLAIGGKESIENLDKVKIREHILIHSAMIGQIDYRGDLVQK